MTHVPCVEDTPSAPAIVGTETLAIVVSSTTRKLPSPINSAATSSLPPVSGLAAASGVAEMVLATDMVVSSRVMGSVACPGIDGHVHRQTDAQRVGFELRLVERDAHGQALNDLDPVARGVL